jgi:hypothetical protein
MFQQKGTSSTAPLQLGREFLYFVYHGTITTKPRLCPELKTHKEVSYL